MLKEINEKLDILIDSVNENKANITRIMSERNKQSERKEHAKAASKQIKPLNIVFINGAKSAADATDMIGTILVRQPSIKWIHQIEQNVENDNENENGAKLNKPPSFLAEISNDDKQEFMKLE